MSRLFFILILIAALLIGCGQTLPVPGALQSVNNQPLPAKLLDTVVDDGENPPYRLEVYATGGWFRLEGNRYEQEVALRSYVDGRPAGRSRWWEFGTCAASSDKWLCESDYIQNYRFELTQTATTLTVTQDLNEDGLRASFVFKK